jgi:hypothetical protein
MTLTRTILSRSFVLAALAAIAAPAVADAAPVRGEKRVVGRIASLSPTHLTVGGISLRASSRQLAGFAKRQCVEVEARRRGGALSVVRISHEDSCVAAKLPASGAGTTAATTGGADDPANHDAGDDHGNHDAGDDHGNHGVGHA